MSPRLKKVDTIIIVAMIFIAFFVLFKIGYISDPKNKDIPNIVFIKNEVNDTLTVASVSGELLWSDIKIEGDCDISTLKEYILKGDQIKDCIGVISVYHKFTETLLYTYKFEPTPKLPVSLMPGNMRDVSPIDEGVHFNTLSNNREWWYFTVVFNRDCDLPGWTATIGFMHMAWGDLRLTFKPDILVVTLHDPNGNKYGGLLNKQRGELLGIFGSKTLEAKSPGIDIKYEDSWALGKAPEWHIHVEDKNIDKENEIIIDLDYFAPSSPYWLHSRGLFDKGEGNIASYMLTGCEVSGKVILNGLEYYVKGIGHHEHSWSLGVVKFAIKGWDWCHMTLNNGWNIYYSKYYISNQRVDSKTTNINPYASLIITTNKGETLTILEDIDITTKKSDILFLLLKMPIEIVIKANPSISQILLKTYNIDFNIDIIAENTYDITWKLPTYVGMKIGLNTVIGKIKWSDDNGDHEVELDGTGTIWNMRKF